MPPPPKPPPPQSPPSPPPAPVRTPPLPIDAALPALTARLAEGTRVLLQAPPGAGKSTVVPLALLASSWLASRKILMLEPRRLAARAVATRMAQLLGEAVGGTVGYRTRLETRVGRDTRIEVVTEGILTRMLQSDPELSAIGCVIFDEFHERSVHADLGLALCLESQSTLREDLRLLVMSATLDLAPLAALLDDAPVVTAEGRAFAVDVEYVPRRPDLHLDLQVAQVVRHALEHHPGDILVFLPGAAEIRRVQRTLEAGALSPDVRVFPLFGELAAAEQDAALAAAPPGRRKVVLATTIAETSLTIEGVRVVVDSGLRRHAQFDPATGMSRLDTGKISQAAAEQRRGRAGRLSTGHCYRLWSEGAHPSLATHTAPAMLLADLAPLALDLACWGTDPAQLRWLDPPPAAPLAQARDLLQRLAALDAQGRVTPHGRALSRWGAHPRLAHMLSMSGALGAARLACDLAAVLSERDILRAMPGARDADVRLRIEALRRGASALPAGISLDQRAQSQALRASQNWQRELERGAHDTADERDATGVLLALAYPDRVGRSRETAGRYVLANGRGAHFAEAQGLSKSEFIVAAELDGAEREARIFLAAPISLAEIKSTFAAQIVERSTVRWDDREQAVKARRETRLGQLVLESAELRNADPQAVTAAVLQGLRAIGLDALPWTRELRLWQARVALMHRHAVPSPEPWPDLSDEALSASLEEWAPPWLSGITRRDHFSRIDLGNALHARLTYAQNAILEREAPTHFVVPTGSRIPIDYSDGDTPTVSVRLQEVFGLTVTPSVANGRMPLLLKLLSPAGRPVQITRDLVSFWERGYHDVKKDLKGRYPKHHWPDDPHTAEPTRRAKSRPSRA